MLNFGSYIILSTFLSKVISRLLSPLVSGHVLHAYVIIGRSYDTDSHNMNEYGNEIVNIINFKITVKTYNMPLNVYVFIDHRQLIKINC